MGAWGKGLAFEAPCPTPSPTEAAEALFASKVGLSGYLFLFAFRFPGSCLSHGLAAQLDAMSVVHEPVEDTVSDGGVPICSCHWTTGTCEVRIVDRV